MAIHAWAMDSQLYTSVLNTTQEKNTENVVV